MTEAPEYHLGIKISLPEPLAEKIRVDKRQFNLSYPGHESFEPHISLYFCRFPAELFDGLCATLGQFNWQPFNLTIGQVLIRQEALNQRPFLFLEIAPSPELNALHRAVVEIANPLRGNRLRSKDEQRIADGKYQPEEVERLRQYGCARALEGFLPHLTLGEIDGTPEQLNQLRQQIAALLLNVTGQTFTVSELGSTLTRYDQTAQRSTETVRVEQISATGR